MIKSFAFKTIACVALFSGLGVATYAGCDVLIGDTQINVGQYRSLTQRLAVGNVTKDELRPLMADGRITHREFNTLTLNRSHSNDVEVERARLSAALR